MGKSYQGDIALDEITFVNGTCDGKELNYLPRNLTVHADMKRGETGIIFDYYQRLASG